MLVNSNDILVFYDVSFLFINVLFNEIIEILVEKVFVNNWFNEIYNLDITKLDLIEFLRLVIKD